MDKDESPRAKTRADVLAGLYRGVDKDTLKASPEVNPKAAALGRGAAKLHEFASKPFGYNNPAGEMISEGLGIPAVARTLERVGYGEPLTTGKGMTTKPRADTMDALMALTGVAPATKGMPVGASINPDMSRRTFLRGMGSALAQAALPNVATTSTGALPTATNIVKQAAAPAIAALSPEQIAAAQNILMHATSMSRSPNFMDRASALRAVGVVPEGMSMKTFLRGMEKAPESVQKQFWKDVNDLAAQDRYYGYGAGTREEFEKGLSNLPEGVRNRELRLWEQRGGAPVEPRAIAEDIPPRVYEPSTGEPEWMRSLPTSSRALINSQLIGLPTKEARALLKAVKPIAVDESKLASTDFSKLLGNAPAAKAKKVDPILDSLSDAGDKAAYKELKSTLNWNIKQVKDYERLIKKNPEATHLQEALADYTGYLARNQANLESFLAERGLSLDGAKKAVEPASTQPFWFNPQGGKFAPFEESGMHNAVIQNPEYAAQLGTTTEEAMKPTSPLLMGRYKDNTLNLMQVAPATDETLPVLRSLLESQRAAPENISFSAGENLFEGIPREELIKALTLEQLSPYKKYAVGGSVDIPDDFTSPDMSDGGAVFPDPDYMRLALQQR